MPFKMQPVISNLALIATIDPIQTHSKPDMKSLWSMFQLNKIQNSGKKKKRFFLLSK